MKIRKNFHTIEVKYIGATNSRGSRVSLYSPRFNTRKIIPFAYEHNDIVDMAVEWLEKNGFEIVGQGEAKSGYIVITNTFKPL